MTKLCNTCDTYIEISSTDRNCDGNKYIFLCKECLFDLKKNQSLISYSSCSSKYSLNKEDLLNIKHIYNHNVKNNIKLFLFSDVHHIIKNKYGNLENFNKVVNKKQLSKEHKAIKKQYIIDTKTEEIKNILKENNLDLNIPHYDMYINYIESGETLDYNTIVNAAVEEKEKEKRQEKLIKKLNKYQLPYNPNNIYCQNYINNNIESRELDQIITYMALENYKTIKL